MNPREIQLWQFFGAFAKWYDHQVIPGESHGVEIQPIGPTTWTSSHSNVISCIDSTVNPGSAECQAIKLGAADIVATASFDFGLGMVQATQTLPFTVVNHPAPIGEIVINYGTIAPRRN